MKQLNGIDKFVEINNAIPEIIERLHILKQETNEFIGYATEEHFVAVEGETNEQKILRLEGILDRSLEIIERKNGFENEINELTTIVDKIGNMLKEIKISSDRIRVVPSPYSTGHPLW